MKRTAPLLFLAACAVYSSSLLLPPPSMDAGTDAGSDAGTTGCPLNRWPARPNADDPSSGDVELVTAITSLHFVAPDGSPEGYDLDGVCTCSGSPPDPESCVPLTPTAHCDGDGGIDNSGGQLLDRLQQIGNIITDSDLNKNLAEGTGGAILRLQGWNGQPNDTQASFSIYTSNGIKTDDAGTRPPQKYDGGDEWTIDSESLVGGVAPPYVPTYSDLSAYVSNGVLVASLDFPFVIGTRSLTRTYIRLKGAIITGRIVKLSSGYSLEHGVLSGRWTTVNFLTALQGFKDPFYDGGHLCGDSGTYQILKTQICRAADISGDILSDRKGAPCDAVSLAFFFEAKAAKLGPADPAMPAPPPCGAAYKDDCR